MFAEELNRLLTELRKKGLSVPEPVGLSDNTSVTVGRVEIGGHKGVAVRLFHFLDGILLEKVPFEPRILFQLGVETAKLTKALVVSIKQAQIDFRPRNTFRTSKVRLYSRGLTYGHYFNYLKFFVSFTSSRTRRRD